MGSIIKYSKRAPDLSHIVWDNDGEVYWNAPDIAIVMGRKQSSIARPLQSMEREERWRRCLLALRNPSKAANGLAVGNGAFLITHIQRHIEVCLVRPSHQP